MHTLPYALSYLLPRLPKNLEYQGVDRKFHGTINADTGLEMKRKKNAVESIQL